MSGIEFRAVTRKDLPLLKRWIAQPHWQAWWGDPGTEVAQIAASLDDEAVEPMIAERNGKPVAYVQTYDPHLEDEHPYQDQPFGTIGIDLSIGEASDLNKGLGTEILTALAALLFEEGVPRLIIDPHPDNAAAIRCYEKAGFAAFDTRTSEYGPALMMARDNPDFAYPGFD
ncbi:MAG: acetyltransferase [Anaerolineae bacterium]|nr:acetyltransferase [Anaerolineae bacterium]